MGLGFMGQLDKLRGSVPIRASGLWTDTPMTLFLPPETRREFTNGMGFRNSPVLVTNAPTKVNYAFVSNNILVTFGADTGSGQVENRILASDYADRTLWTSSSTNQVLTTPSRGGRLISHIPVEGRNLIFTENQTHSSGTSVFHSFGRSKRWTRLPAYSPNGTLSGERNGLLDGA